MKKGLSPFFLSDCYVYCSGLEGNDSNLLIVFYVQIMPDDLVMQLHRF
ncbi:TRAP transporter subunit DctM [Escherichia coli]|nr:TRAP transporter subunit DctM [Escherichia coli]CTZ98081.1 TRAP transporter subunit DctM [Escherichia coli]